MKALELGSNTKTVDQSEQLQTHGLGSVGGETTWGVDPHGFVQGGLDEGLIKVDRTRGPTQGK